MKAVACIGTFSTTNSNSSSKEKVARACNDHEIVHHPHASVYCLKDLNWWGTTAACMMNQDPPRSKRVNELMLLSSSCSNHFEPLPVVFHTNPVSPFGNPVPDAADWCLAIGRITREALNRYSNLQGLWRISVSH